MENAKNPWNGQIPFLDTVHLILDELISQTLEKLKKDGRAATKEQVLDVFLKMLRDGCLEKEGV